MEKNENLKYYSLTRMTPYGVIGMLGVYGSSEEDALRRYAEELGLFGAGWELEPLTSRSKFVALRYYNSDGVCRAEIHAEYSPANNYRIYS